MKPEEIKLYTQLVELFKTAVGPVATLLAGYIGVRYGLKQVKTQKKLDFIERQLREFYSPMLGFRKEILAKSELRVKISKAANEAWRQTCERSPKPFDNHEEEFEPYKRIIEYDNAQLRDELLPLYKRMLSTFSANYWLAEPETRKWFTELCEFVELWERWLSTAIPADVIEKLDHREEKLYPFYEELEKRMDILRKTLS